MATTSRLWSPARASSPGYSRGRFRWILTGRPGRDNGNLTGQTSRAIGADRAVHGPFQAMAGRGTHDEHVAAAPGEPGQHGAWVALRRLDGDVNIARDTADRGTKCLPDKRHGLLPGLGSGEGQHHVPATVVVTAQAAVPRQAERPYPDGHKRRARRTGQLDCPAQCCQATRRVINTHDYPSSCAKLALFLTSGGTQHGCHHLSPPAVFSFSVVGCWQKQERRCGPHSQDLRSVSDVTAPAAGASGPAERGAAAAAPRALAAVMPARTQRRFPGRRQCTW